MGAGKKRKEALLDEVPVEILDRGHLARYTMENPDLEREIIELFLSQLSATLAMLKEARKAADWKLATHTLKGSAAAVGAGEINRLALALEASPFSDGLKACNIEDIEAAVLRFEQVCREVFG